MRAPIQALLDHDGHKSANLTETAWLFLETNMSLARTSEQLHIHRNTVRQRLERISRLIGQDWLHNTRRLDLHLALRIWRLQETLPISATHVTSSPPHLAASLTLGIGFSERRRYKEALGATRTQEP